MGRAKLWMNIKSVNKAYMGGDDQSCSQWGVASNTSLKVPKKYVTRQEMERIVTESQGGGEGRCGHHDGPGGGGA